MDNDVRPESAETSLDSSPKPKRTKRITAGLGGGVALEWFDWNTYGLMAAFLAPHFFPSEKPVTSVLSALAVFGAGFFARPLGAAILGPIADRISHKTVMMISVSTMAVTSIIIAFLPTYERIGIAAGIILLFLRLLQGLSTGAEAGVANAIAVELAEPHERGRYLGLISGTFIQTGIFGASLFAFIVSASLPADLMGEWGWRIPFAFGGLLGLLVVYLRSALPETLITSALHKNDASTESTVKSTTSVWKTLWNVRLGLLAVVLVIGSVQIANYAWITGLPNLANGVYGENSTWVFGITTAMGVIWITTGPLIGTLADKMRPSRAFTVFRLLLVPGFFMTLLYTEKNPIMFILVMMLGGIIVGVNMNLYNYIAVTLMPRSIRTTGVSIGYALGVSIFGGTSSYLLVWLIESDLMWVFPVYGSVIALLSISVYWIAKRRGHVHVGK